MHRMLSLLAVTAASLLLAAPVASADRTVAATVPPGGSVSLDAPGTAPTPGNPVVVTVHNPACDSSPQAPRCGQSLPSPDLTFTITERTTPTVTSDDDIVGPQYDLSVKNTGPQGVVLAFATSDVDASLLLPGFYGSPGFIEQSQQLNIPGLGFSPSPAVALPGGDLRYSGQTYDATTHGAVGADGFSYAVHRLPFAYNSAPAGVPDVPSVRSRGLKVINVCGFACGFTLTATISQKAAAVLGLRSKVIAKGRFEQSPTVRFRAGQPPTYTLRLTSAAKAALRTVPKTVKVIKFALDTDVIAPAGVTKTERFSRSGFPFKLLVKAPKRGDGGI